MRTLITLAALALSLFANLNPARASEPAAAPTGFVDVDADSVNDRDEPSECVDKAPIPRGAHIQLTGDRAGCWTAPKACIIHRLVYGGDVRACGMPEASWNEKEAEAVRGLDYRLNTSGNLVQVDGTLVAYTSTGWVCTEPQLYLYSGGKVTKAGKDAKFASAFGPEQPPACSYSRLEAPPSAARVERAIEMAREARRDLDGLVGPEGRVAKLESGKVDKSVQTTRDGDQDKEIGRVERESKSRDEDLGRVDLEMGETLRTHAKAIGQIRQHGGFARIGMMVSGYGIQDGLKMAGYRIHVDPHGGLRLSFGYRYLDAKHRLLVLVALNGDLHWNAGVGGPGTIRGGAGLGGQVGGFGFPLWSESFALGLGGSLEVRGEWYNLSSIDYDVGPVLHTGTLVVAPTVGVVGLCGTAKRFGFQLNAGPAAAVTWLPDASKVGTGGGIMPPVDFQALALFRF